MSVNAKVADVPMLDQLFQSMGPTAASVVVASLLGLIAGSGDVQGVRSPLIQVSKGGDAANLILGLPTLLGSMWFAKRGSLFGLLPWPGALFYVLYAYALYLVGAPFNALLFAYVALVTLSAWSLVGVMASIDGEVVRRRLALASARSVGGALVVIAVLAYAGLAAATLSALGSPTNEAGMRPQWVVDYALGTPGLLLGGALLWRRAPLGYVAAPGLLLVSGLNGLAFAASAVLDGLMAGRPIEPAVIAVHLVISGLSFALLALFARGATERQPVEVGGTDSRSGGGREMKPAVVKRSKGKGVERTGPGRRIAWAPISAASHTVARPSRWANGETDPPAMEAPASQKGPVHGWVVRSPITPCPAQSG